MSRRGEDDVQVALLEHEYDDDDADAATADASNWLPTNPRKRRTNLLFRANARSGWLLVAVTIIAWLVFLSSIAATAQVEQWVPVAYSARTKVMLLAACILATTLVIAVTARACSAAATLHGANKQQAAAAQLGGASTAALVVFFLALIVVGRNEPCTGALLVRVFVGAPTRTSGVSASVFLPSNARAKPATIHVLDLEPQADNARARLSWTHDSTVAPYIIDYDIASGAAFSSSGAVATFTWDHAMNITFSLPAVEPVVIDDSLRDATGAPVLQKVGFARGCSILKLCAARFAPEGENARNVARVLFPLGILMREFATVPHC